MGTRDPRIDAYIGKSAEFARPILAHLREVVHEACPDVEETLKWSMPHFMYEGMLCGMAAFKQHCSFGFWKGSLIVKPGDIPGEKAMGQFGCIRSLDDLPPRRTIAKYVKEAMKLNEQGVKSPTRSKPRNRKPVQVPEDLDAALRKNRKARTAFDGFSPSHRREYIEWITEAKREETRQRRIETAIDWISEGKSRNWKYVK
jgi:uncharacterized protein YdeI (YjbR/CyaY-like superfamily)